MKEDGRGQHENSKANLVLFEKGQSGNPNGRGKGVKNRKTILMEILNTPVDQHNEALILLKKQLPEFFPEGKVVTFQDLVFIRLLREAIFSGKPIVYIRELFDRTYGRCTFELENEDEESSEWERRMDILDEQLKLAESEKNNKNE